MENNVVLTHEGVREIEQKLEYLKAVKRMEVAEQIKTARAFGDLSENSEYDSAKEDQGFLEGHSGVWVRPWKASILSQVRKLQRGLYRGQVPKRQLVRVDWDVKRKPAD